MRTTARVVGLSLAACTLFFVACSSSDDTANPATGGDGGASSGSSGQSSSGASSSGSSGASSSSGSTDGGTDPDADKPVPVGDGSLGAGCNKDDERKSKVCAIGHKCVLAPSCRGSKNGATPGIDTCGKAEPGDESCCTSLTLPKTTTRTLDKFEITSGRIRAFISSLPNGNLRKFAKDFAAAHPSSELGKMVTQYPGYIDVLPDHAAPDAVGTQLPLWLGAFPQDAINRYDGCFVSPGGFGAATYWQDPSVLKKYDIGYNDPPDGTRKYSAAVLDTKPANCMPPVLYASFCAWDGGELAQPSDYYEVWGHETTTFGPNEFGESGGKFTRPWATILKPGEFNWRNGHGIGCPIKGYPGCDPNATDDNPPPIFFSFPKGGNPADDDSPEIGAPGRFQKDVTAVKSPDGAGWFDIGGNMLEAAWPKNQTAMKTTAAAQNYCDTYAGPGGAGAACNRDQPAGGGLPAEARPGTKLFTGQPPPVALIGGSFEVHIGYGEAYFANATDDETKLGTGFPAHFQYGKLGGRCARVK